jgi:hypothetical protein
MSSALLRFPVKPAIQSGPNLPPDPGILSVKPTPQEKLFNMGPGTVLSAYFIFKFCISQRVGFSF